MAPKPPVIGAAASDAQVAVGVYWYIPAGQDTLAEPPPEGARLPSGSTTAGPWPVVSKCALREGRQRERSTQVIPGRSPFGSLLLVDHRLSGLCHSATNEPSANVYLGGETTLYTIHLNRRCLNIDDVPGGNLGRKDVCWGLLVQFLSRSRL